jgi:large subunit ribosomal protein L21
MVDYDTFAIITIENDPRQYVVVPGETVDVEKLDKKEGSTFTVKSVLLVKEGDKVKVGKPHVKDAEVKLKVEQHAKDKKVKVFKYRAKSRYRKKKGHRQQFTRLIVEDITLGKKKTKSKTKKKTSKKKKDKEE